MNTLIVIPARYGSTRFPGKPLADIQGKSMIQHVHEKALQVGSALVATDDERIASAVKAYGGWVEVTSPEHPSSTDRLGEIMERIPADLYINLQGDEPLVRVSDLIALIDGMREDPQVQVGTLCHPISPKEAENPNSVKVVLADNGDAMYFSRVMIPYPAGQSAGYLKHIGIYAYRKEALEQFFMLPQNKIEQAEKLEQLRLLAAGIKIRAYEVKPTGPGVDTPECLEAVKYMLSKG